mmetsp:Transcript_65857/g.130546  ORF Transcript_65857/g.130546 Transcript_65857/m.130546 type:complete len:163 (-) Transcript_65857:247-735(-)|eukprot:CAMPEP_0174724628 /NCGR_PEP_ID=MMETSP1094-20130205/43739_1 /TAXON_ID=156173 /ORGANISM="Chrysochromulina brevifilum, Strain UTEX LB 985" /LENGTH=162 /DNA_ID=CAMNT_0015925865 /DNA_START=13 /DNA_END=501 /DNA_ORIENTATION=-
MTSLCVALLMMLLSPMEALQFTAVNCPSRQRLMRSPRSIMQAEPGKLTWNTALDAEGQTYYWNSAGASTYDMPADFDASTAKAAGTYKASGDGALYDDEIPEVDQIVYTSGQKKPTLSNTMREKMIAESRGLGADPSAKNPFGAVFIGVGVFVVLGALAVNM